MPPPLPPSLPTDRLKLFSGVQHKHSSCSFACPAFRSTSLSSALAYAHPDDAAQQSQQNPHHQNAPQQRSTLPRLALALATPDTKWRTVAIRIVLGKLHGRTGSPPKPFWFILHPVPSNIHSNDLSFTDTAAAFQLCYQALPC